MGRTSQENTKNDADTIVSSSFKIGSGTSFPQEAFYYYIKKIETTAINRAMIKGNEVDIFIPSLNVGIEYDGVFYHSGERAKAKEQKKNRLLQEQGIRLIRVKEQAGDSAEILFEEIDEVTIFTYSVGKGRKYLGDVIVKVLTHIFGECTISINPLDSVHELAILESYRQNLAEMSLEALYPDLVKEWHPSKNGLLKPSEIYPGSNYNAWWVCKNGHEWKAQISNRTHGNNCPVCTGRKVLVGFNDLQTKNPELAKEWHPTKNGNLKPTDVTISSGKKVWWACNHGHEWEATIDSRRRGTGCPVCSGNRVLIGFNDLQTINPKLSEEWHSTKNGNLKPTDVTISSHKKVWWKCKYGHEWKTTVANRSRRNNCPICSGKKVLVGFNDLQTKNPELAKEWHPTKNGGLKPTDVTPSSGKKVWWVCKHGHEWETIISNRTKGSGCPYCSGNRVLIGFNDLQTINPELVKAWHPTKNGNLKPTDVTPSSGKKVWWVCEYGHEWEATVDDRTKGSGCPYCSGNSVLIGFNDLQTKNPELAKEWHPTKNGNLKPTDVTPSSQKKVWWKCKYGHEWKTTVAHRTNGRKCPYCSGKKVLVGFNDLQTTNPNLAAEWHPTKNGNLKPIDVTQGSDKKVWWRCEHGHEWEARVYKRTAGTGCPICSGNKVLAGFNDLQTINPELAKEWHPTKNGDLKPTEVMPWSHKTIWWRCEHEHEWVATIDSRSRGASCPICYKLNRKKYAKK